MSKIDVARLNALRPKPKPSEQPPELVRTPSDDGDDPMEEDRVSTGRTLRRRKEKVMPKIDVARLNALRPKPKPSEQPPEPVRTPSDDGDDPMEEDRTISRIINDPGIIAACHCGDEYETEYSESIDTHTETSIDSGHQKSIDIPHDESVDSSPDDWENDYYNPTINAYTRQNMHIDEYDEDFEEERAIEYRAILDEENKLLHHSSWKRNAPSFDMTSLPSIDTQPQQ
ncbi:hypothetical protein F2Q70_00002889 [Brassica cretica]|uniref:Uncharacterized protein n=1 Tax=Brassica cretica TaxID=69181 RepID=A0A8S9IPU3_BRACR|nr:hypothetical protein F2Q70_00002889 [Brassica cretica]